MQDNVKISGTDRVVAEPEPSTLVDVLEHILEKSTR